jgi:hypothetical protein
MRDEPPARPLVAEPSTSGPSAVPRRARRPRRHSSRPPREAPRTSDCAIFSWYHPKPPNGIAKRQLTDFSRAGCYRGRRPDLLPATSGERIALRNGALREPTCVIAGAGPRLGLAIAERYASEGFAAYLLSRHPARVAFGVSKLRADLLHVVSMACDVERTESVEAALREIRSRQGGCDVLIYNASAPSSGRASMLDPETLLADFRVNVTAALSFVRSSV